MSDLIRKMCAEYESGAHKGNEDAMRAALRVMADNVTDNMIGVMHDAWLEWDGQERNRWEHCLKTAIREAAR